MDKFTFLILIISVIGVHCQTRQGCLPNCECGQQGNSNYKIIKCQKFPTTSLPPDAKTFQSENSPPILDRRMVENLKPVSVETVDLYHSGLKEIRDDVLPAFPNLLVIKLSFNNIQQVSANTFKGCNQLQEIYLDSNKLTTLGDKCFSNLPRLQVLQLHHNMLNTLPPVPPTLQVFDISHNQVTAIDKKYKFQNAITYVDLCSNPLQELPRACFISATKLNSLCASTLPPFAQGAKGGSSFSNLQNITLISPHPSAPLNNEDMGRIKQLSDLTHLAIVGYDLSNSHFLEDLHLHTLKLQNVRLTGNEMEKEWLETLSTLPELSNLDLENSPQLAKTLTQDHTVWERLNQLKHLNLQNCELHGLGQIKSNQPNFEVDLSENPLQCDCNFGTLSSNIKLIGNSNLCTSPQQWEGKSPAEILPQLNCQGNNDPNIRNELPETEPDIETDVEFDHNHEESEDEHGKENAVVFPPEPDTPPTEVKDENNHEDNKNENDNNHEDDKNESEIHFPPEPDTPLGDHTNSEPDDITHYTVRPKTDMSSTSAYLDKPDGHTADEKLTARNTIIIIAVVIMAFIAAVIITGLFFYFRRRGTVNVNGNAYYTNEAHSRDELVHSKNKR